MNVNPSTISVKLASTLSGTVKAGDALKFSTTEAGDLPVMDKAASADLTKAVVIFNAKKATWAANEVVEVALAGSIINMEASTAINRGTLVSWNSVSQKIQTTTTNYIGYTLDIASASGDIVRVFIQPALA